MNRASHYNARLPTCTGHGPGDSARALHLRILGIETSCDETAAAIVEDGVRLLANVVASQTEIHARYGGIVPELASRQHVREIGPTIEAAVEGSGGGWDAISAVAVTHGPGLAGSLIVGVNAAKGLAASLGVPLAGVNHLEGHIYASWVRTGGEAAPPAPEPEFPLMCLVVSGGHTDLIQMQGHGTYRLVGRTRDDAAGEAFDKAARVLGLGFPGGPAIQRAAEGAPRTDPLPRAWLTGTDDFSFSGLKTALLRRAREEGVYPPPPGGADPVRVSALARAFQEAAVDAIAAKTIAAAERHGCRGILVGGGVAASRHLREELERRTSLPLTFPPTGLSTDNGAMIAACAFYRLRAGDRAGWDLDVLPSLHLG